MNVTIGDMRHRLQLEAPLDEADGGGGVMRTWALIAEVWAALKPLSGDEKTEADGVSGRISHRGLDQVSYGRLT